MKFIFVNLTLIILTSINISNFVFCDLPVHCLKHNVSKNIVFLFKKIKGEWIIKATIPKKVSSGHEMLCGHNEPSDESSAYKASVNEKFSQEYHLVLDDVNVATVTMNNEEMVSYFNKLLTKIKQMICFFYFRLVIGQWFMMKGLI